MREKRSYMGAFLKPVLARRGVDRGKKKRVHAAGFSTIRLPSSSTESPVLRVSVTTDGCQSTLPTRSGHPRHSRTNRNIFVDKRHRLCYERQPCSPTGVSRERSLKRQRGRRFGSAAVERREARPLRISLRRGRDTEGGCRARSAVKWRHLLRGADLRPSASRRSAPVGFGSEFVDA